MKRIWYAITLIAIATILCVGEQVYIRNFYNNFSSNIEYAYNSISKYDMNEDSTKSLVLFWRENEKIINLITDSNLYNELDQTILSLQYAKNSEIKKALAKARVLNNAFYENQKLSVDTVF